MKARVNRLYWEELEKIIDNITDKVTEIECIDVIRPFHDDEKRALLLLTDLDDMKGGCMND